MSDDVFDGQMLAEKLSKLNSSQQSIESLSQMCMSQRKKAKQIVGIWHKSFKSAQKEQHVAFLYLANDILQNSRRKGTEFVTEFWKVMSSALKHVNEHGDDNGKKAASRLVGIWDERRVFGSRGHNLKEEMLGKTKTKSPPTQPPTNGKTSSNSNPIKIVKRDANSVRLKVAVGDTPEKIMTALHLVYEETATEDTALNNCEGAVHRFGVLERDFETQGVTLGSSLVEEIQEQENVLQECVTQLETAERTRTSLISQLKEALHDQESKLDVIQNQLQVARHHAVNLRKKLSSPQTQPPPPEPTTEEDTKKAAAAAVAAKLAASTSSAQMLASALSSLVAEEAAASLFSPEKRQKLDQPPPPSSSPASQFVQSMMPPPYMYGGSSLPPPHMMRPGGQNASQMPPATGGGGYYRPPGIGFYGPGHQPPPVPRQ